ncbi:MAG: GTPase ObgE [Anaerolineae bacterium]|nr:GTPase ObgE [Anaerolineae bacterium]
MYYDEVKISVRAGKGGDGCVSFRREAMVPRGGPDGGNGGRGGDVILRVNRHLNTLQHFQHKTKFIAEDGENGRNKDQTGKSGEAMYIDVPPGTVVRNAESNAVIGDLTGDGDELCVARGGRGGRGNPTFATATNQAPLIATNGNPGEAQELLLEMKLIADIGFVGMPNAGKSTLLSVLTAAKPKIAAYPFTTLVPNLGVAKISEDRSVVVADIPGLIEGASQGLGLGHEFLRHIERTRVLIHLIDGMSEDPIKDYQTIQAELAAFGHGLAQKPQVLAITKMDLPDARAAYELYGAELRALSAVHVAEWEKAAKTELPKLDILAISAATGENVRRLIITAVQLLEVLPPPEEKPILPVIQMTESEGDTFQIKRDRGGFRVISRYLEHKAMITRWDLYQATEKFQVALDRSGVSSALLKAGIEPGDMVFIGDYELEWQDESKIDYDGPEWAAS